MLNEKINQKINNIVRESVNKQIIQKLREERIKDVIYEEVSKYINQRYSLIKEASDMEMKRNSVMKLLKDKKFKNSQLAYSIWPDMDKDTARSLFSKMVSGEPDNEGNIRAFSDKDITSLYELLRSK